MKSSGKKFFSGSTLKWFAIIVMLIDHVGACLLEGFVFNAYGGSNFSVTVANPEFWFGVDMILRCIGRSAFPIFCFLLAEGACHTRSMPNYIKRLAIFALISEIPFDLAIHNAPFVWEMQNVFFTLLLGAVAIWVFQKYPAEKWKGWICFVLLAILAEVLHTDYGAVGVVTILLMYLLRDKTFWKLLASYVALALASILEIFCLPGMILIALYNGERGRQPKYFFYAFYPVHLLILWAIGNFLLPVILGQYSTVFVF